MRLVVTTEDGKEIIRAQDHTNGDNYDISIARLHRLIEAVKGNNRVISTAIGVAGAVTNGRITGSGNLPNWTDKPLEDDVANIVRAPTRLVNDCEAATHGEATIRTEDFVYFVWGTGCGASACFYENGRPHIKPTEIGHATILSRRLFECGCGGFGHLEASVGGSYLEKRLGHPKLISGSMWSLILEDLAQGIYNVAVSFMGMPIVFGGGVAFKQLGEAGRLAELQDYVSAISASSSILKGRAPQLSLASHGEDSGLIGAAVIARQLVG